MDYIKITDGFIVAHYDSKTPVAGCVEADGFDGVIGQPVTWFDNWKLRPVADLIADGLVEDNTGIWYNTETKLPIVIEKIGTSAPIGYTSLVPGLFDYWDNDHWETDSDLETANENLIAENAAQNAVDAELAAACNAIITWMSDRFTIPQTDFDFVDGMTDIADVKVAVTGILNKLSLDAGAIAFVETWQAKYSAWLEAKVAP